MFYQKQKNYGAGKLWFEFFLDHKLIYFWGFLSIIITNLFQVLTPRFLGWALDFLKGEKIPNIFLFHEKNKTFIILISSLFLSSLILFFSRMGWRLFLARNTHHASAWLRKGIWSNARYLPIEKLYKEYSVGNLMNISTSDVLSARYMYGLTLVAFCDVIFLTVFTLGAMLTINLNFTLWTCLLFPILPYFIIKLAKQEGERHEEAQEFLSKFNEKCAQCISTIKLQRMTQTGSFWEKRLVASADQYRMKRLGAIFTSYKFYPLMGFTTLATYVLLFSLGINKVITGQITIGEFVVMQSYIFLIQEPLLELGFVISEWQRAITSLNRIATIYNEPKDLSLLSEGLPIREQEQIPVIDLKLNHFQYPESERVLFSHYDLSLNRGGRLGIIGTIGRGKTSLINIMSGLERKFEGELLINGRHVNQYSHYELRRYIGVVPQRSFVFADTIKNNVKMDQNLSDDEVWHYLEIAGLADEIRAMPLGLETGLGEWGINLSGGQRQRLSLARTLAMKPKLLFLDDCLSAVDTVTEENILKNLNEHLKETTLVWVAHRSSTLKYCEKIIDLDQMRMQVVS